MQSNKKYPLCMFVILNMSITYPVVKLLLTLAMIRNLVQYVLGWTELILQLCPVEVHFIWNYSLFDSIGSEMAEFPEDDFSTQ